MKPASILVVDDEESIRFTFRRFLEGEGFEVATAAGFDEAARHLADHEFELAFVDIILQGRSGMDVLREIKRRSPTTEVVIVTGAPSLETASESMRMGALDYVVKPVRQHGLLQTTRMALRQRSLSRQAESSRQHLEAIFRSVQDGIITVDREFRVLEVNEAARTICRMSRDELVDRPLFEWQSPCTRACFEALHRMSEAGTTVALELVDCGIQGRERKTASVRASPLLGVDGEIQGGVLVIRDETRLIELERCLGEQRAFSEIIGTSRPLREVLDQINALARVDTPVLILGESGTGKELVAEALHAAGPRHRGRLVKVNCSALTESLLESELFGHVRGAFTGAVRDVAGRFEMADGGTIFLDEIGEISHGMQLRFLRVLESKEFERVGDPTPIHVDVRVVAATNRDLKAHVDRGEFRDDLYYRLAVFQVQLPPLRERREDIPLLVSHFLARLNAKFGRRIERVADAAMESLLSYSWPGNVRQLENALEHAFGLCRGRVIAPRDLPSELSDSQGQSLSSRSGAADESKALIDALKQASNNRTEAARLLGVSRRTLYRRMARHGIVAA
jgi:PAS domain S-box-containing protein